METRSIHILPNTPKEASGYTASVFGLCEALEGIGMPAKIATFNPLEEQFKKRFVESFRLSFRLKSLGASIDMRRWLSGEVKSENLELIHVHSLWRMACLYPSKHAKNLSIKFVVSPRGTLSPQALKYSSFSKKIFSKLLQTPAFDSVAGFHATSFQEYCDIRNYGFRQPIAIIPNGISDLQITEEDHRKCNQVLFVGRIHPIKGIENLLKAWSMIQHYFVDWELIIAGPGEDKYIAELKNLARKLKLKRYKFLGPVYGADKQKLYLKSRITVLPTLSENFGMVVAESLSAGTPVIVTKGAPWEKIVSEDAGWWIDIGAEPLAETLNHALNLSKIELSSKGKNGQDWMSREFSWEAVANDMKSFYGWLINNMKKPDFVHLD